MRAFMNGEITAVEVVSFELVMVFHYYNSIATAAVPILSFKLALCM